MKSGEVLTDKRWKWYEPEHWRFGDPAGKEDKVNYPRHATGQIYGLSRPVARYIAQVRRGAVAGWVVAGWAVWRGGGEEGETALPCASGGCCCLPAGPLARPLTTALPGCPPTWPSLAACRTRPFCTAMPTRTSRWGPG